MKPDKDAADKIDTTTMIRKVAAIRPKGPFMIRAWLYTKMKGIK